MVVEELAPAGGIEGALVTLAAALRPLGVESVVLSCQPFTSDNQYVRQLKESGVALHHLPPALWHARDGVDELRKAGAMLILLAVLPLTAAIVVVLAGLRRWPPGRSLRALIGHLKRWIPAWTVARLAWNAYFSTWCWRERVDVIHVHGYGCGAVPGWAIAAAAGTRRPVVYSEHGIPWPGLRDEPVVQRDLSRAQHIIAVSQAAARAAREQCRATPPIDVIYHVVQDTGTLPGSRTVDGALVFGCAAMLRPPKGHIHWIESMPAVLRQVPNARFVLAGDGSERSKLMGAAQQFGVRLRVEFLGQVPNTQLRAELRKWDVFVLPSLEEPLGIVLVEAMAAGLPIVATAAGGVTDLVRDGETALLVPPGDSAALAAAQVRLAHDPPLRQQLGQAARAAYEAGQFTPAAVGQATVKVYRSVQRQRHSTDL
jgi:glycosyltransferase involved in cell wall biosynthesis